MGRYFGTDGIRGVANGGLTTEIAFRVGAFLGNYYSKDRKARIVIGKDTRLSSSMLENALASGISAFGGDCYLLSYTSTPCLAYVTESEKFDCGVMISASHNPFYDNGIKVFSNTGLKLDGEIEGLIEDYLDNPTGFEPKTHEHIGQVVNYHEGVEHYFDWLDGLFDFDLSHLNIALDLANGSNSYTAREVLSRKGANLYIINDKPNGININNNCGSTHLGMLCDYMRDGDYDIGFAFDGDADRVLVVDHEGNVIDGDKIMYVIARYLKSKNMLDGNKLVTTVMSNIGLFKALDRAGIGYDITPVGDKNVVDSLVRNGFVIGGEQSGHIINTHEGLFGDGLKTAMNLLRVITDTGLDIDELSKDVIVYPQLLVNAKVHDKNTVLKDEEVNALAEDIAKRLGDDGRILVRPSGTEPLIRVMVEAQNDEICHDLVYEVIDLIDKKGYTVK